MLMGVKGGTQTWSTAPQQAAEHSSGTQNISATERDKFFGDEALGDTLNKVADPNYVNPSKKMRTTGNAELGKDAFMTLLLTQMKNQDPTSPLKSHEMAAQLAQFTSLEKLNNINEGIGQLRKDNQPDHNFQALAMIGKSVTMDNSKINRTETGSTHELRFTIPADAQKANVDIKNANGEVVRKMEMKALKAGSNQIMWNGKTDEGAESPIGDYTLAVEAFGSNGKKLSVQTKAEGIITGVNFTAHGAQLLMGKQSISLADVKQISDPLAEAAIQTLAPQAMQHPPQMPGSPQAQGAPGGHPLPLPAQMQGQPQAQAAAASQAAGSLPAGAPLQGPRKVEVKPESKGNDAKRANLKKGNLSEVPMAQGLINNLNKEGAKAGGMQGS